ncbi:flagellar hook-associated protein 2 protein [Ostertagia ostertagi]
MEATGEEFVHFFIKLHPAITFLLEENTLVYILKPRIACLIATPNTHGIIEILDFSFHCMEHHERVVIQHPLSEPWWQAVTEAPSENKRTCLKIVAGDSLIRMENSLPYALIVRRQLVRRFPIIITFAEGNIFAADISHAIQHIVGSSAIDRLSSATNTFAETVAGLSITVSKVTTDDVNLQVTPDTNAMKKNIQDFVAAYNAVNDLLSNSTKYDPETKVAGVLQGDSTAVGLQGALRMLTMGSANSAGAFQRLSDVGISMERGGKLTVDAAKLDKAIKDPASLKALFATPADTGQGGGIGVQFKSFASGLLSLDGLMNNKTDALNAAVKRNTGEQDKVNDRAAQVEKRLRAQYTALDTKMASLTSLGGYINQQVASWNKAGG